MDFTIDEKTNLDTPRKTWVAIVFSLLLPGLGQVYNGQLLKAVWFHLLATGSGLAVMLFSLRLPFPVLAVFLLFSLLIYILAMVDAIKTARKFKYHFKLKKYNRLMFYIAIYLVLGLAGDLAVSTYVKSARVQAYKIPSKSMDTTLLVGDHILLDKSAAAIGRGDIVIFEFPPDAGSDHPRDFIKRVVGVPGDRLEIRGKQLLVNNQVVVEKYVVHQDTRTLAAEAGPRDNMAPVIVPEKMFFTLGDNRDYSFDSRFWGFVGENQVSGWAARIYWSWDREKGKVRWQRIGQDIY